MIECEKCGEYFHPDEITECLDCLLELCELCSENHQCIDFYDACDDYDEIEYLPKFCPICEKNGQEVGLQLDINFDSTKLYCEKCTFIMNVTEQLSRFDDDLME